MGPDGEKPPQALPAGVRRVVAVGGGKGGVGKSSVAANLAVALSVEGLRTGLLDADVHGPSQPQLFGIPASFRPAGEGRLEPPLSHGVRVFSMGFFLDPQTPVAWRGPRLHRALQEMLHEVAWGELDVLFVDLPPGTGDVPLSLAGALPLSGAVVVTTPQSLAVADVRRAVSMFRRLGTPVLGVVENMAGFVCPHCGKGAAVFAEGGAEALSKEMDVPLLGRVPLDPLVCESGERGAPVVVSRPESPAADALLRAARRLEARLQADTHGRVN